MDVVSFCMLLVNAVSVFCIDAVDVVWFLIYPVLVYILLKT
jgi:hypothetical protein